MFAANPQRGFITYPATAVCWEPNLGATMSTQGRCAFTECMGYSSNAQKNSATRGLFIALSSLQCPPAAHVREPMVSDGLDKFSISAI